MTPRSFFDLVKRRNAKQRHELYCAALVASATYNVHRKEGSTAIQPTDIIGDDRPADQRQTVEETKLTLHMLAGALGGTVTTH